MFLFKKVNHSQNFEKMKYTFILCVVPQKILTKAFVKSINVIRVSLKITAGQQSLTVVAAFLTTRKLR